ncbi:MFS transporter [Lacipirellula sp.]|uniref:MFS transporter n=1 Tax=Lacipirellula sp. TaxID=2691419 RepID=UPI003D136E39
MSSPEHAAAAIDQSTPSSTGRHIDFDKLPTLYHDPSFWGMTVTQFLGAFNDNLFKQIVMFLSVITISAAAIVEQAPPAGAPPAAVANGANAEAPLGDASAEKSKVEDRQGTADMIFGIPFLLVTGYAGYLADRYGKRSIIIWCKVAEVFIMAAGAIAFYYYVPGQLTFLYVVLFLMGTHSGFFGPAKYGILPEMLRPSDLPRANGFILMTTFLSIILGGVVAGVLKEYFETQLWLASVACISIAVVGTISSLWVRRLPAANPEMKFEWSSFTVPPDMRALLRADRPLLMALIVSSLFWMLAGMVKSAVTAAGLIDQQVGEVATSYLFGIVSVGIAAGAAIGGLASKGKVDFRVLKAGALGMLISMLLLAIPSSGDPADLIGPDGKLTHLPGIGESRQWIGYYGGLATLLFLGISTGCFAVPLQVFMQQAPPEGKKGRMIAVMNQANWVGIVLNGVIYGWIASLIEANGWPRCTAFLFIAALMLPIVLFYHPKADATPPPSA